MSVKVVLRKTKINKQGKAPLFLRVTKNGKTSFKSIGIYLDPKDWDEAKARAKKTYLNSTRLNNFIATKIVEAERLMIDLEAKGVSYSSNTVKEIMAGTGNPNFFTVAEKVLSRVRQTGKFGTYKRYKSAIQKFRDFNRSNTLTFPELTYSLIIKYEQHLIENRKNSVNTITANLKVIQKIIREAIREDFIRPEQNPFNKYKMRSTPTFRMFLTESELTMIENLPLKAGSEMEHHKNAFIFACNCGLRISDILQLRWKDLKEGRIHKVLHKTQETVSVKLNQKALAILERYRPDSNDLVFPLLKLKGVEPEHLLNSISSATAYLNKNLRKMAKLAKITKPLTSHIARHTFATRALSKGLNILQVSYILGHKNLRETQIYAKLVSEDLDKAMDKFND